MAKNREEAYRVKKFNLINENLLMPYQSIGAYFLLTRKRAILSYRMGLGKTPVAIVSAHYLMVNTNRRVLIICPKPLVKQWVDEISKFADSDAEIIDDFDRKYKSKWLVVNYEKIRIDGFEKFFVGDPIIICDEATKMKNFDSILSQRFYRLCHSEYIFMLTATPITNSPLDIWALFKQLKNDYLESSKKEFLDHYGIMKEIELKSGRKIKIPVDWKNLDELADKVKPLILVKTYDQVYTQLPLKTVVDIFVEISQEEVKVYNKIRSKIYKEKGADYKLALLTYLKRFLDAPKILEKDELTEEFSTEISSKMLKLLDLVEEYKDKKIIIISQYADVVKELGRILETEYLYYGNISVETVENYLTEEKGILIMTDKGSYGLNLQGANILINYDLPWSDASLEQRIGRVYRIGQTKKVLVFNLVVEQEYLIESYIRQIIGKKRKIGKIVLKG